MRFRKEVIKMDFCQRIKEYRDLEIKVLQSLDLESINKVMNVLENARKAGQHIFICGNGGSAATASHFAGDFNKGVNIGRIKNRLRDVASKSDAERISRSDIPMYNFECLSDNQSSMMAVANDESYAEIFRFPLAVKMKEGDIVIGVSGSGNSANVVNALDYANNHGGVTVALVGYDGGKMKKMADYCIHVNINDMQITEDIHMFLDHLMMWVLTNTEGDGNLE